MDRQPREGRRLSLTHAAGSKRSVSHGLQNDTQDKQRWKMSMRGSWGARGRGLGWALLWPGLRQASPQGEDRKCPGGWLCPRIRGHRLCCAFVEPPPHAGHTPHPPTSLAHVTCSLRHEWVDSESYKVPGSLK